MLKAQASAELVVVVSGLMLIFLLVVVIKSSYEDLTKDYMERLEAERIAKNEFGYDKLVIISGVGVREYFYKKGYVLEGPYVTKKL